MVTVTTGATLPGTGRYDTGRVVAEVLAPFAAQGVIVRRRAAVRVAARFDTDARAVRLLRQLRDRYGRGPLRVPLPGRDIALVLDPDDVRRVLTDEAAVFRPASTDKVAALARFQPHGVLVSTGRLRQSRRRFVERVLQPDRPEHDLAGTFDRIVADETARLTAATGGRLDWDAFARYWWRIVRRVVLGDAAADDEDVIEELAALRRSANWGGAGPERRAVRRRFQERIDDYVRWSEPGSLAALVAGTPAADGVDPAGQVPHWLFAFDAAGIAAYRTLALLAARPDAARRARAEAAGGDLDFLRACVLEAVRLWPTTMAILRESVTDTDWRGARLPAGTQLVIVSALFHRDEDTVRHAHAFAPAEWLSGHAAAAPAIVPFSAGPGRCPGRAVVLLVTSLAVAALLRYGQPHPVGDTPLTRQRLPGTLDHYALRVALAPADTR